MARVVDTDPHYFGKPDRDPDPHPHEKEKLVKTLKVQNGAVEGHGHSQPRREAQNGALEGL